MAAEGKKPGEISIGTMKEFEKVNSLNFEAQAIFFLNAFWVEWGDENKERVWILTKDILDVDMQAWVGCDCTIGGLYGVCSAGVVVAVLHEQSSAETKVPQGQAVQKKRCSA
eukprot:gb/GEZN01016139.1/.p2 GENE.gb/GEZN01016139.1/~~gb/GEZN01016139.1/.p2  ORF type:complete len:112 (-),score=15.65 gb/GEZN01016139.1/:464-799(-)